jgi:hypothetical protein
MLGRRLGNLEPLMGGRGGALRHPPHAATDHISGGLTRLRLQVEVVVAQSSLNRRRTVVLIQLCTIPPSEVGEPVARVNQGENSAKIRMRMRRGWARPIAVRPSRRARFSRGSLGKRNSVVTRSERLGAASDFSSLEGSALAWPTHHRMAPAIADRGCERRVFHRLRVSNPSRPAAAVTEEEARGRRRPDRLAEIWEGDADAASRAGHSDGGGVRGDLPPTARLSEPQPASDRNRWPASYRNAWPVSWESAPQAHQD